MARYNWQNIYRSTHRASSLAIRRIGFARRPVDEVVGVLLLMKLFLFFYVLKIEVGARA